MHKTKKWESKENSTYTFLVNGQQAGVMKIERTTLERKAIASYLNKEIIIRRTGFWKNHLEVTDSGGILIAKLFPEKWYSGACILEYGEKTYKLLVRNNPLAEYAIQENEKDLLAYGLASDNGQVGVSITTSTALTDYLFDFILWYLFLPIATEQGGNDLTFLTLIA